jgi:hypothetical protein
VALYAGSTAGSAASSFILCKSSQLNDVVLELDATTFEGTSLSCLSGDFVSDMTPCAPTDGFGLSAPTGGADLVKVVNDWRQYGTHVGGVVGFSASSSTYRFQGGFHYPSSGYQEAWTFEVGRLTGEGTLSIVQEVEENGSVGRSLDSYRCEAASKRF